MFDVFALDFIKSVKNTFYFSARRMAVCWLFRIEAHEVPILKFCSRYYIQLLEWFEKSTRIESNPRQGYLYSLDEFQLGVPPLQPSFSGNVMLK